MARRTVTYLIDDLDGSEIAEGTTSTSFSLNGVSYTIDLASANVEKLEAALAPFIEKAKRSGGSSSTGTPRRRSGSANSAQFLASVREWANSHGYTVGERGRVKTEVLDAYRAAH